MTWMETPLTLHSVLITWRWDTSAVVATAVVAAGYLLARSRAHPSPQAVPAGRVTVFLSVGTGIWLLTGISVVGAYSGTLFWVRALQTLLLLYVVPFGLAAGRPVTVLREALGAAGRRRLDRALHSTTARALTYPLVPSVAILAAPWLLFLTPWYEVVLRHGLADAVTRILLVALGFGYFYSRLQADPVPRRYSQGISLLITVAESLADGILGLVLWLGPLCAAGYYAEGGRTWGPDMRLDQIIGAGIIWILGDVLGLPYLLALMRSWASDERRRAAEVDAELDALEKNPEPATGCETAGDAQPSTTGLWWENDPQLRARFHR